jgi:dTDP-4-dehydrorhamnose reductase/SAM-dependent methyltransferase
MKVLVIGAGGVIGQHMYVTIPSGVDVTFTRKSGIGGMYEPLDITRAQWPDEKVYDAVVNLAGENNPDWVERNPEAARAVNVEAAVRLAEWCRKVGTHYIHISSQAANDVVNEYGRQKWHVDEWLRGSGWGLWTIVRPSFVLGIRPFPGIGRENPAERMMSGAETQSVSDRKFTACFAWDVARVIWDAVVKRTTGEYQVAGVDHVSRWDVAQALGCRSEAVSHDSLPCCARPLDTTFAESVGGPVNADEGFAELEDQWDARQFDSLEWRAQEIAAFMRLPYGATLERLVSGFGALHKAVNDEFRACAPKKEQELLDWYRNTDAYIWELTAYHCHPGFNYAGMVSGIIERLKSEGVKSVLCLGDGTGDLSLACDAAGLEAAYNDLQGSRIAQFAETRMDMRGAGCKVEETMSFSPWGADGLGFKMYDAVVSLDFLEHVPNVDDWVRAIYDALKPGGIFVAQNAFAIGSGPDGSIPMHLAENDHWEKDWDPLLLAVGFVQMGPQWYRKVI